jgi:hypothetical protein
LFLPADDNGTRSQRSFDLVGFLTLSPSWRSFCTDRTI